MGSDLLFLLRKLKTGSFVSILDTMLAEQPSAQGVLSIRRYVLPLLTSWKQKKSPGSIAAQWIRAVRSHDSSLSDTYGHRSCFRHYVLTPPIPFSQIIHCKTEPLPPCQCCLQRVALADSQGAADFLGDHDAAEVV